MTDPKYATDDGRLTPRQRLATQPRLLRAGITTISDMETLRACVAYENTHQNRLAVLERLRCHADELRVEDR